MRRLKLNDKDLFIFESIILGESYGGLAAKLHIGETSIVRRYAKTRKTLISLSGMRGLEKGLKNDRKIADKWLIAIYEGRNLIKENDGYTNN